MPYSNLDKRREKSRDAARSRRHKEQQMFTDLTTLVPVSVNECAALDKASVVRLVVCHMKIRRLLDSCPIKSSPKECNYDQLDLRCDRSLNGFLVVVGSNGDLILVSENVQKYLGISHLELMGSSIFDFSHPCDHDELQDILDKYCRSSSSVKQEKENKSEHGTSSRVHFQARFKCTLTQKGRNVNLKAASYKVLTFNGRTVPGPKPSTSSLILVAQPIFSPDQDNGWLSSRSFLSKHNLNLQFSSCDARVQALLGYQEHELIGNTLFDYQHAVDAESTLKAFKDLYSKGQTSTLPYRFLVKGGGYVLLQTESTILFCNKSEKPKEIMCVHHIISEVEEQGVILSHVQLGVKADKKSSKQAKNRSAQQEEETSKVSQSDHMLSACPIDGSFDLPALPPEIAEMFGMSGSTDLGMDETAMQDMGMQDMGMGLDLSLHSVSDENPCPEQPTTPNLEKLIDDCPNPSFPQSSEDGDIMQRTPFIPMSGEEDLMFGDTEGVSHENRMVRGATEQIFVMEPEDEPSTRTTLPLNVLRQQWMDSQDQQLTGTNVKSTLMPKLPPTNETNRLETGPPSIGLPDWLGAGRLAPVPESEEEAECSSIGSTSFYDQSWGKTSRKRKHGNDDWVSPQWKGKRIWESDYESDADSLGLDVPPPEMKSSKNQADIPGSSILKALLSSNKHENYDLNNYSKCNKTQQQPSSTYVPPSDPMTSEPSPTLRGLLTQPLDSLPTHRFSNSGPIPTKIMVTKATSPSPPLVKLAVSPSKMNVAAQAAASPRAAPVTDAQQSPPIAIKVTRAAPAVQPTKLVAVPDGCCVQWRDKSGVVRELHVPQGMLETLLSEVQKQQMAAVPAVASPGTVAPSMAPPAVDR